MNPDEQLPLFVYGTLLSDQPAYDLIAAAVVRSAVASVAGLRLYSVGRYPIAVPGVGCVNGEAHWLRPHDYAALLRDLETYEGPEYTRTRWLAAVARHPDLPVWVFTGELAAVQHLSLIASGDWRRWLKQSRMTC